MIRSNRRIDHHRLQRVTFRPRIDVSRQDERVRTAAASHLPLPLIDKRHRLQTLRFVRATVDMGGEHFELSASRQLHIRFPPPG